MANRIEVVLFDLGGVLIELSDVSTMMRWAKDTETTEQLWTQWLTSPTVRAFETGDIGPRDFAEQLIEEMALPVQPEMFIEAFTNWPKKVSKKPHAWQSVVPSGESWRCKSSTRCFA